MHGARTALWETWRKHLLASAQAGAATQGVDQQMEELILFPILFASPRMPVTLSFK